MRTRPVSRFAGVLGWPLERTLSPTIHNAAFRQLSLDWIYLAFPVAPDALAGAVGGLRALGAMGANVTMPHKESIIPLLDEISGDARSVGAVNTIQRVGHMLVGHNTDVDGFKGLIVKDAGASVAGRSALVLGAGGAARAVVKALDDLGCDEITIAARTVERGQEIVPLVGRGKASVIPWEGAVEASLTADVVVNATPVGAGADDQALPGARWRRGQLAIDLVYDPTTTAFLDAARAAGAEAWGGLGMLVHQAAASLRIWTGQDPPLQTMSAAAVHSLGSHARRFPDKGLN